MLAYHDITADPQHANAYSVTPRRFRAHLRLLRRTGYEVVPLTDIVQRLRAGQPVDGMAAVVFDDGLVGVFRHAVPALVDAGVPATVFALTHGLGTRPP